MAGAIEAGARHARHRRSTTCTGSIRVDGTEYEDVDSHSSTISVADILRTRPTSARSRSRDLLGKERFDHYLRAFGFGQPTGARLPRRGAGPLAAARRLQRHEPGLDAHRQRHRRHRDADARRVHDDRQRRHRATAPPGGGDDRRQRPAARPAAARALPGGRPRQPPSRSRACCSGRHRPSGTGTKAQVPGYPVAGKTGTARKPPYEHPPYKYVASFVGFAPGRRAPARGHRGRRRASGGSYLRRPTSRRRCSPDHAVRPHLRTGALAATIVNAAGVARGPDRRAGGVAQPGTADGTARPPLSGARGKDRARAVARPARRSRRVAEHVTGDRRRGRRRSRTTADGSRPARCFACIPGARTDGHDYAPAAVQAGRSRCSSSACLDASESPRRGSTRCGRCSARWRRRCYGDPSPSLRCLGVTGTNGKTTTTPLLEAIAAPRGTAPGVIGTVGARVARLAVPASSTPTTPEATELQALLAGMRDAGVDDRRDGGVVARARPAPGRRHAVRRGVLHQPLPRASRLPRSLDAYFAAKARLFDAQLRAAACREPRRPLRSRARGDGGGAPGSISRASRLDDEATISAMNVELDTTARRSRSSTGHAGARPTCASRSSARSTSPTRSAAAATARAAGIAFDAVVSGLQRPRDGPGPRSSPSTRARSSQCSSTTPTRPTRSTRLLAAARALAGEGRVLVVFGVRRRPRSGQATVDGRRGRRRCRRRRAHLRQPAVARIRSRSPRRCSPGSRPHRRSGRRARPARRDPRALDAARAGRRRARRREGPRDRPDKSAVAPSRSTTASSRGEELERSGGADRGEIATIAGGEILARRSRRARDRRSPSTRVLLAPGGCFVALVAERDGHDFVGDALPAVPRSHWSRGRAACRTPRLAASSGSTTRSTRSARSARAARDALPDAVIVGDHRLGRQDRHEGPHCRSARRDTPRARKPGLVQQRGRCPAHAARGARGTRRRRARDGRAPAATSPSCARSRRPSVGVITNVGLAHAGPLGGPEGVALTKGELLEALPPHGLGVLDADDAATARLAARTRRTCSSVSTRGTPPPRYGHRTSRSTHELRPSFTLVTPWGSGPVQLHVRGDHQVVNAALAAAVALHHGVPFAQSPPGSNPCGPARGAWRCCAARRAPWSSTTRTTRARHRCRRQCGRLRSVDVDRAAGRGARARCASWVCTARRSTPRIGAPGRRPRHRHARGGGRRGGSDRRGRFVAVADRSRCWRCRTPPARSTRCARRVHAGRRGAGQGQPRRRSRARRRTRWQDGAARRDRAPRRASASPSCSASSARRC